MQVINTVFKINTKEKGYSFFWTFDKPKIDEQNLEALFPKKRISNLSGFSLGISCFRMDQDRIFIAVKSDWNISDAFGRESLSLCEGSILNFNSQESTSIFKVIEYVLNSLVIYDKDYKILEKLLSNIAINDSKQDRENFFSCLDNNKKTSNILLSKGVKNLLMAAISKLDVEESRKFRVYSDFPVHNYIGLCFLIILQIKYSDIKSIGMGDLEEYNTYNHISTNRKVDGFEDININQLFGEVGIFYKNKADVFLYVSKIFHKMYPRIRVSILDNFVHLNEMLKKDITKDFFRSLKKIKIRLIKRILKKRKEKK
jgi:hypothetical protein